MKNIIPTFSIIIGIIFFVICILIPIFLNSIPEDYAEVGFIISSYLSLVFFAYGILKIKKQG